MSETKFTPGPWHPYYLTESSEMVVMEPGESIIAEVYESHGFCGLSNLYGTRRDNAHLIAAAPELYSALEDVRNALLMTWPDEDDGTFSDETVHEARVACERANAALAKARGEQ